MAQVQGHHQALRDAVEDWRVLRREQEDQVARSASQSATCRVTARQRRAGFGKREYTLDEVKANLRCRLHERWCKVAQARRRVDLTGTLEALEDRKYFIDKTLDSLDSHSDKTAESFLSVLQQERGLAWELLILTALVRKAVPDGAGALEVGSGQTTGVPFKTDGIDRAYLWYTPGMMRPPGLAEGEAVRGVKPDFVISRGPRVFGSKKKDLSEGAVMAVFECKSRPFASTDLYKLWGQARHLNAKLGLLLPWDGVAESEKAARGYSLFSVDDKDLRVRSMSCPFHHVERGQWKSATWTPWMNELGALLESAAGA